MSNPLDLNSSSATKPEEDILISADSHAVEPGDLWDKRLPPAFRDKIANFKEFSSIRNFRSRGGRVPLHLNSPGMEKQAAKDERRGRDPIERLKDEEKDGVYAEVIYPSRGAELFFIEDAALQEACFEVYNDWLTEFCKAAPDRIYGLAMISTYNADHAAKELERCKKAGLCGATIWLLPPAEIPFSSDHYDRFWAAAQDLEMPVGLHKNTGFRSRHRRDLHGIDAHRYGVCGKVGEIMDAFFDIIFSGVLDRFPRVKIISAENDIGWIPYWLDQADKYFERYRKVESTPINKRPSDYFGGQLYATFFNEEFGGSLLGKWVGVDNCMWSNDYPHSGNMTWPYSREVIARDLSQLQPEDRAKLLRGNVARLYNLNIPNC